MSNHEQPQQPSKPPEDIDAQTADIARKAAGIIDYSHEMRHGRYSEQIEVPPTGHWKGYLTKHPGLDDKYVAASAEVVGDAKHESGERSYFDAYGLVDTEGLTEASVERESTDKLGNKHTYKSNFKPDSTTGKKAAQAIVRLQTRKAKEQAKAREEALKEKHGIDF